MKLRDLLGMPVHEAAQKFPFIDDDRMKALAQDIHRNGLLDGIVTYNGEILDGRNRLRAFSWMLEVGGLINDELEVPTWEYDGDDPNGFVIAKNAQRRQLSTGQRVLSALLFEDYYAERAEKRLRDGASRGGSVSKPTENSR